MFRNYLFPSMNTKPSTGKILISEPFLGDPNFERSVVFLCEHTNSGTFGLVLNQLSNLSLEDVLEGEFDQIPLYVGGPVEQNTLHYLHKLPNEIPNSIDLGNGVYWSGDFEAIKILLLLNKINSDDIRFFIGYSGWGEGQLDSELSQNAWFVSEISSETLFNTQAKDLWRKILRDMGGDYKIISHYPIDPRLN
jgi:putative transcriptional regulator